MAKKTTKKVSEPIQAIGVCAKCGLSYMRNTITGRLAVPCAEPECPNDEPIVYDVIEI